VRTLFITIALTGLAVAQAPPTTLTGLAVMPADTLADGPPSGAWLRADAPGTPQFPGQPVQGISSLSPISAGEWWALSDNGFGGKLNSADYLLRIYRLTIEWSDTAAGRVSPGVFIQLADPDRKLPFPIARESTRERWLTGADLDPESMVRLDDGTFWIGDEFGPFLLHFAADGRLLERPYEIPMMRGPDHPHMPAADVGQGSVATVRRSRGFEGLAHFGGDLYAALESGTGADADAARVYEFNLEKRAFSAQTWRVALTSADHALTELVSLARVAPECAARFLAIERDGGHGRDAKLKRVREIQLAGNAVVTHVVADLLAIDNPRRIGGHPALFTFPFITTEALWPTARDELVLANDNNYPAGGGRPGATRDQTEFIRLKLGTPLCSR
jgi:glycerophosphoryl diester phosphodiesterase